MVCGRERLKPHICSNVSGLSPEILPREIRCPSCRSPSLAGLERICKASSAPAGMDTACPRALSRLSPQSAHCKSSGLMMKQREPSGSLFSLQPFADNKPAVTVVHRQSSRCGGDEEVPPPYSFLRSSPLCCSRSGRQPLRGPRGDRLGTSEGHRLMVMLFYILSPSLPSSWWKAVLLPTITSTGMLFNKTQFSLGMHTFLGQSATNHSLPHASFSSSFNLLKSGMGLEN